MRINVRKAVDHLEKLACSVRAPWCLTAPKRETPRTEYKKRKRNRRPPTFVS